MRPALFLLLLSLAPLASADRLITIPRGGKIPYGTLRVEALFEPSRPGTEYLSLGFGATTFFDVELRRQKFESSDPATTADLAFNVSAPITDFAPGITFGILDLADSTRDGRRIYAAISFKRGLEESFLGGDTAVETTIGYAIGSRTSAFVGVSLPISDRVRFMAEHNGIRPSAALEYRLENGPFFRAVFQRSETLIGLGTTTRF